MKQAILNVIFERAYELEQAAIQHFILIGQAAESLDYEAIKEAALKKAFTEWKENKAVFEV